MYQIKSKVSQNQKNWLNLNSHELLILVRATRAIFPNLIEVKFSTTGGVLILAKKCKDDHDHD